MQSIVVVITVTDQKRFILHSFIIASILFKMEAQVSLMIKPCNLLPVGEEYGMKGECGENYLDCKRKAMAGWHVCI